MYIDIYKDQMQKAYLFGTAVLYSDKPIPQEDVPQNWFSYEFRGTVQFPDEPYALENQASYNYAGSVLSPLPLKKDAAQSRLVKDKFLLTDEETSLADFCSEYHIPALQPPIRHMLRPASPDEAGLFFALEPEEDEKLGAVGHIRIDFGHGGDEFRHSWWPRGSEELNTPEFREELGKVVDDLRKGVLKDLSSMRRYCYGHDGAIAGGSCCQNYGFVLETEHYTYRLRCNPVEGDYQAYLTAFDKRVQAMGHSLADAVQQDHSETAEAHSYTWYVVENINSPKRRVDHELPLEEAIQLYASLKTGDKQLSVAKDGLASVDLVIRKGDLEWFPEDRLLLGSFADDEVVSGAVDQLRQALGRQIVGRISFANGEQFDYTDPQEYIAAIREELPYHPTTGFRYETLTSDPEVRRAVDAELYDLYGMEPPEAADKEPDMTMGDMSL